MFFSFLQEICEHKEEIEEFEKVNAKLEAEVKSLLQSSKTNIRRQMFPEFYPEKQM